MFKLIFIYSFIIIPKHWKSSSFAQVSRLIIPSTLKEKCKNVMISDIDYAVLPSTYWDISSGPENMFIAMRKKDDHYFYMGFNSASPATWSKIFEVSLNSDADVVNTMQKWRDRGIWKENSWGNDQDILQYQLEKFSHCVISYNEKIYKLMVIDGVLTEEALWTSNQKRQVSLTNDSNKYIWLGPGPNDRQNTRCFELAKEYIHYGTILGYRV